MTEPTDAELPAEWDRVSHIADAGQRRLACLRAVLAKWGVQPVPAGYALVPVEPTPEMLSVMWVNKNSSLSEAYNSLSDAYSAMLAASPQPVVVREAFHKDTGCTPGGDINLAERVCRVVEHAHGITPNGRKDGS